MEILSKWNTEQTHKNLQEKVISSKESYMSFTRDNFISNTSSDLIQNNEQSHVSQGT